MIEIVALCMLQTILFPQQTDISLEVHKSNIQKPWAFLAPHQNENIINDYVAEKVKQHGGVFVILRQNGERHIQLSIDDFVFEIDPNRIFTHIGRKNTLSRLNPELESTSVAFNKALARAESLAQFIMSTMGAEQAEAWIAIHNNTNGYDDDGNNGRGTVSIKRYQKRLDSGAKFLIRVHDANIDEDNLFFITEPSDYTLMAAANWNVVLQNPEVAKDPDEDDGSLSVLAEMQDKRYINAEAERSDNGFGQDDKKAQKQMIDLTFEILNAH